MTTGWILIAVYILLVSLLLVKDEYHNRKEQKRRVDLRAEIHWPLTVNTREAVLQGETVNISAAGALICGAEEISQREIISLTIKPPVRKPLEITAEVVRNRVPCRPDGGGSAGIAVRFIIISERDRQFLLLSIFDKLGLQSR